MKTRFIYSPANKNSLNNQEEKTLLLIHGLERFRYTLSLLTWRFKRAGWNVLRFQYPCHLYSFYDVAEKLREELKTLSKERYPDLALGYSMGGVILSELLREQALFPRALILASPLLYSQAAAIGCTIPLVQHLLGPSLLDLAKPRVHSVHPDVEVATIAGFGPVNKKLNPLLSGPNDGLVQVKEAHPDWGQQKLTIYGTHPGLVAGKKPFEIMNQYLETGILNEKLQTL